MLDDLIKIIIMITKLPCDSMIILLYSLNFCPTSIFHLLQAIYAPTYICYSVSAEPVIPRNP